MKSPWHHSEIKIHQKLSVQWEVGGSLHWAVRSGRERVSRRSLIRAHILSAFPPWSPLERPTSTCDLHTWPVSSPLPQAFWSCSDESCDHTLASEASRASQVSHRPTHILGLRVCVFVRWINEGMGVADTLTFYTVISLPQVVVMAMMPALRKKSSLSFSCVSCIFSFAWKWEQTSTKTVDYWSHTFTHVDTNKQYLYTHEQALPMAFLQYTDEQTLHSFSLFLILSLTQHTKA